MRPLVQEVEVFAGHDPRQGCAEICGGAPCEPSLCRWSSLWGATRARGAPKMGVGTPASMTSGAVGGAPCGARSQGCADMGAAAGCEPCTVGSRRVDRRRPRHRCSRLRTPPVAQNRSTLKTIGCVGHGRSFKVERSPRSRGPTPGSTRHEPAVSGAVGGAPCGARSGTLCETSRWGRTWSSLWGMIRVKSMPK